MQRCTNKDGRHHQMESMEDGRLKALRKVLLRRNVGVPPPASGSVEDAEDEDDAEDGLEGEAKETAAAILRGHSRRRMRS